jgi:anaerobic selenocysteine-containing dehydrogenase
MIETHYRACHLCEAICGLKIETRGEEILSIKGDPDDPLSRGHICPKAVALKDIHEDPDRLRYPVRRVPRRTAATAGSKSAGTRLWMPPPKHS